MTPQADLFMFIWSKSGPPRKEEIMRNLKYIGAALVLATAGLATSVLIRPRVSEAALPEGVDVRAIERMDRGVIPEFDATYQRRIGVLDPL
jgi:hypothetical protein